jgi:hypothetical protein
MKGDLVDAPSPHFWERFYQTHLPACRICRESRQRWLYYKLWPNMAFDIYADQIDFMQWLPGIAHHAPCAKWRSPCPTTGAR